MVQILDKPINRETLLDLVLTKVDELIEEVKTGGSLGCSDHALVEFMISRNMGLTTSKVRTLKFRKTSFHLFTELMNEIPWETVFRDKGPEQSWQLFKATFLRALMPFHWS